MKKTDNYGARVKIENIIEGDLGKVDENSLFALLTGLTVCWQRNVSPVDLRP